MGVKIFSRNVQNSVYGYGSVNNGGNMSYVNISNITSSRIAVGRYRISFTTPVPNDSYVVLLTKFENQGVRDDVNIDIVNQNVNSFNIMIHEGDNSGTANIFRDRPFNFLILKSW